MVVARAPDKPNAMPARLDKSALTGHAKKLAKLDPDMAQILRVHGVPPMWSREPGFVTLIRIILEQQVSLTSADAMFRRLQGRLQPITPLTVLKVGAPFLRSIGITRQKASYFINVSQAIDLGELDLEQLATQDDESIIEQLISVKGIGPWTARIYLLMALCRPDVWPVGDIALATAVKNLKGLKQRPTQLQLTDMSQAWAPYRATAARMLWNYYLNGM